MDRFFAKHTLPAKRSVRFSLFQLTQWIGRLPFPVYRSDSLAFGRKINEINLRDLTPPITPPGLSLEMPLDKLRIVPNSTYQLEINFGFNFGIQLLTNLDLFRTNLDSTWTPDQL